MSQTPQKFHAFPCQTRQYLNQHYRHKFFNNPTAKSSNPVVKSSNPTVKNKFYAVELGGELLSNICQTCHKLTIVGVRMFVTRSGVFPTHSSTCHCVTVDE